MQQLRVRCPPAGIARAIVVLAGWSGRGRISEGGWGEIYAMGRWNSPSQRMQAEWWGCRCCMGERVVLSFDSSGSAFWIAGEGAEPDR